MKSKVYFTKVITPEKLIEMYNILNIELRGKIAIKVHTGESGNQNYLKPEFYVPITNYLKGTIVECNTAYKGERNYLDKHLKLLEDYGWNKYFNVDIMDSEGSIELKIPNGKTIKENYVGKNIEKYDSMLVVSHFKGHPMGGYGGALKQLSIGCASTEGKSWIHSAGFTKDQNILWENVAEQNLFLESMADSASSVVNYFKNKIAFINVMKNLSVDCDCCHIAEDPCMEDIGILSSLDPVALDKACMDLIKKSKDKGKNHFLERVQSRNGEYTIECSEKLNIGSTDYELINID